MPGYDYQAELRPWTAAAGNISSALTQLPRLRAQVAQQRQSDADMAAVRQAQVLNYGAETTKRTQETKGLEQDQQGDLMISKALRSLATNPNDTNALADLFEGTGKSFRHNPKQTSEAVGMLMSTIMARQGSKDFPAMGAMQGDAASIANNQADNVTRENIAATRPTVVPERASVLPPGYMNDRSDPYTQPSRSRPGSENNLYDPATRQTLIKMGDALATAKLGGDFKAASIAQAEIENLKNPGGGGGLTAAQIKAAYSRGELDARSARVLLSKLPAAGMADVMAVPFASQTQDPDDSTEAVEEPTGMEDDGGAGAAMPQAAQPAAKPTAAAGAVNVPAIMAEANQAIQAGADPAAVKARLREKYGITVK